MIEITEENFENEVIQSDKPVLVDFWGNGCPPCQLIAPEIEALNEEISDKVKVLKANVEANMEKAAEYQIMGVPTIIAFKDGREIARQVGYADKNKLKELVKDFL